MKDLFSAYMYVCVTLQLSGLRQTIFLHIQCTQAKSKQQCAQGVTHWASSHRAAGEAVECTHRHSTVYLTTSHARSVKIDISTCVA